MTARTWEELREEWFLGLPGGVSPTATVQGFASARAFLGDDWPEKFAQGRGFWDAVEIIDTGLALEALNGIPKFDRLLDKVPCAN